jgi:transcriptional activator protein UGA3
MEREDIYNMFRLDHNFRVPLQIDNSLGLVTADNVSDASQVDGTMLALAYNHGTQHQQPDPWDLIATPETALPKPRRRRYAPRSRDGCLTCRARRKKCDAKQPVCQTCVRVNATCQWAEKLQISDYVAEGSASVSKKRPTAASVRSRQIFQDTRLNGQHDNVGWSGPTPSQTDASLTTIPRGLNLNPRYGRQLDPSQATLERHLLSHYIYAVIPQTTIVHSPANFFNSLYIPMAFQHTAVLDMIIAYSASHLARSTRDPEMAQELRHLTAQRQKLALDFIQKPLYLPDSSDWTSSQLEIITVLLFAVSMGAQGGDRTLRWMQRVNCIRELLNAHRATPAAAAVTEWETSCVQQHFQYYDVMSLIMEEALDPVTRQALDGRTGDFAHCIFTNPVSRSLAFPNQDTDTEVATPQVLVPTTSTEVNCLLGLSEELFGIMARIRDLRTTNLDAGGDDKMFWQLHSDILDWRYDDTRAAKLDINSRLDLIALAECHRLTALILLFRTRPSQHSSVPALASQIISIIQRIGSESTVTYALTPILFLAGAELQSKEEIDLCTGRLKNIPKPLYTDAIPVEEVLQMIWSAESERGYEADWMEFLRLRKWTINLG